MSHSLEVGPPARVLPRVYGSIATAPSCPRPPHPATNASLARLVSHMYSAYPPHPPPQYLRASCPCSGSGSMPSRSWATWLRLMAAARPSRLSRPGVTASRAAAPARAMRSRSRALSDSSNVLCGYGKNRGCSF